MTPSEAVDTLLSLLDSRDASTRLTAAEVILEYCRPLPDGYTGK